MMINAGKILPMIQDALAGISPVRLLVSTEEKDFRAVLKKLERLAAILREPPEPEQEQPDFVTAGTRIHELAMQEVRASNDKLTYVAALRVVCARPENLPIVLAYSNLGRKR